jgi:glucose dehydrogenase
MTKVFSKNSITAISVSLLFILSSVAAPVAIASKNSPTALAASALSQLQANWAASDGNQFNQNYNPQNLINSSNAQYLGLNWLFPLPTHPTALLSVAGGLGVDTAPLIINGTIYAVTQFDQVFALNAANGNVLWTTVLPITPNSTQGLGIGGLFLHLHNGAQQFTTKLFGNTPTYWIAANDQKVYALNALNGKYELNFSIFTGVTSIAGNNPGSVYSGISPNILVDQSKGIVITSIGSPFSSATGRCYYRGWNVLVTPPQLMWTAFCTPPQPGSALGADPNWTVNQVKSMKGAQIFYPGPAYNGGGFIPGTAVVDLKTLSAAQLNATLYNDWGYVNQTPACAAHTGGSSTGGTAAGWGAPWLLGAGPTAGLAFVNTNNKDPYNSPCTPGPNLWSAGILALNETTGAWVWGFQSAAHEAWDYDCSWWQAMGNETVNGVNTQVIWKTCKNGYLFELNALTGSMIWAWEPTQSILPRCAYCFMYNPLNSTQMNYPYFNPAALLAGQGTLMYPSEFGGFEDESSYSPALNYIFIISQNVPLLAYYVAPNSTNYKTNSGTAFFPPPGSSALAGPQNNATVMAVNAATGQMVWSRFIPTQGYRGGNSNSGNVVYVTLSSGSMLMINAQTGALIKDYYIGGPLNVLPSIGATIGGNMQVIVPITAGLVSWGTGVPGDIVAFSLQNVPVTSTATTTATATATATATTTATATATTTAPGQVITTTVGGQVITTTVGGKTVTSTVGGGSGTVTVTSTASGSGVDTTTLYGVAAVAVILAISTGYLAMKGRKPGP